MNRCNYIRCGYNLRGTCHRRGTKHGWCELDKEILHGSGFDPKMWQRYAENSEYLYVEAVEKPSLKQIIDKERRMVCK